MKICRLCLSENTTLISFLHNEDLAQKIQECVRIDVTDGDLPPTACDTCIQKIHDWATFKDMCLHSNQLLLQRKKRIKADNFVTKTEDTDLGAESVILQGELKYVYACDICSKEFSTCIDYLDHQNLHNGDAVFKCDKCTEVFTTRDALVYHDQNHKAPCPKCGKIVQKNSLKLHLIKHTDRHKCPECRSSFSSRSVLQQHIITLHTNEKDHICETCGKRFSSKTSLNVHLKSHSDLRKYECKSCNYAGRTASALYIHMAKHARDVCVCEVCSKIFKSSRNLYDHLRRNHSKDKKHQCNYCDKKFVDKYVLTVHMRSHTGVRPYSCRICNKTFIRQDGLKDHMATHGDRVYLICETCERRFMTRKGRDRHRCGFVS